MEKVVFKIVLSSIQGIAMARRIDLHEIVYVLNGSFVSRNNDFRGYRAIGQLKSLAICIREGANKQVISSQADSL
ncbi:hypothetical protein QJN88_22845, partial [Escherichia coli]|uniref:hypothetical protein n=1 Tax=Escherichia coli TaxID=562 RepID=UPI0030076F24